MRNRQLKQQPPVLIQPPPKLSKEQQLKLQLSSIETNIFSKLENEELNLPKTKIPYLSLNLKKQKEEKEHEKLLVEKKELEQKLKLYEKQQKQYLAKSRMDDKSEKYQISLRSQFTQEDKVRLKKLKKKLLRFENSIAKKDEQIQQDKIKAIKQQQQKLLKQRKIINDEKKSKISHRLQQLKQRSLERQAIKNQTDNALKKVQKNKKLHEVLDQTWKQKYNQEEKKRYQLMEKRIQQRYINFEGLKQHEKKYEEIIMEKKRQIQQKRLSVSRLTQNSSYSHPKSPSKFYTLTLRQEQQAKQEQQKKKQKFKLLQMKKMQYSQLVKSEFAPRLKTPVSEQDQEDNKITSLTKQQLKQLGNSYLKAGNKKIKKQQKQTIDLNDVSCNLNMMTLPVAKHKDYLAQSRKKKQQQNHYNGFYNSPRKQAQKIMKDASLAKEDKIGKIQLLATRFESSNADIIAKIQGKLQILQAIN